MAWHRIFGLIVLVALVGVVLRPGATNGIVEANGTQAPLAATPAAAGVPVVVRSGGASLLDNPDGTLVRQVETGVIVQALSRTPSADWIFVEVEAGVRGWLASSALVSVNPAALPVYGRPQAQQPSQPLAGNPPPPSVLPTATPAQPSSPTPQPTATATTAPTATPTAVPPTATPLPTATATANQPSTTGRTNSPTYAGYFQVSSRDPFLRTVGVVRSGGASLTDGPSAGVNALLPAGEIVTLLQRNEDDSWLEVARADGSRGWVKRAELLTAGISKVHRVGDVTAVSAPATTAPVSETVSTAAAPVADSAPELATVYTDGSRLNVRSGPGSDFPVVAKAENGSRHTAIAISAGGEWIQIEIAGAPDGTGWVSARFVVFDDGLGE